MSRTVINFFSQFQLCGSRDGVLTAVTTPEDFRPFNPFAETPVQGTHWDYGPTFGKALSRFTYTTPRLFRMSFGVRF
jgi:hypothetical protein